MSSQVAINSGSDQPRTYKTISRVWSMPVVEVHDGQLTPGISGGGYFTQYAIAAGVGTVRFFYRGKRFDSNGSFVMVVQPDDFVQVTTQEHINFRGVYVPQYLLDEFADEQGVKVANGLQMFHSGNPALHRAVMGISKSLQTSQSSAEHEELLTWLLGFTLEQAARYDCSGRGSLPLVVAEGMRAYIRDAYDQQITLTQISKSVGLNKFHALRVFKRHFGVTPIEFQRRVRVAKAMELLRRDLSGVEVAKAVGFFDHSHMVHTFRQFALPTPRSYQIGH